MDIELELEQMTVSDEVCADEARLASDLRACCNSNGTEKPVHLYESAKILLKMGRLYIDKAESISGMSKKLAFIKAAALIAGAKVRFERHYRGRTETGNNDLSKPVFEYLRLISCILSASNRENISDAVCSSDIVAFSEGVAKKLNSYRDEERLFIQRNLTSLEAGAKDPIKKQKERIQAVKKLLDRNRINYLTLMKLISMRCNEILGGPPSECKFALVGLGSLAREEVTLYSDFEHMILLQDGIDDSPNGAIREYFRWYSVLFQVIVIWFGETYIPTVGVKSLNDLYSDDQEKNWFFDAHTPGGVSFDGRFPHSCKIPLGKQEPSKHRKHVVELIQPVKKMLNYLTAQENLKNGYHLRDVLVRTIPVDGDYEIYKLFNSQIGHIVATGDRKAEIAQQAEFIVKNVNPFLSSAGQEHEKMDFTKIKDFFYRPITILVSCLSRCCLRSCSSSFRFVAWFREVISQYHEESAEAIEPYLHDLEYSIAVACEIRAKLYASTGQQRQKALATDIAKFVSENCVATCFCTIKITSKFFHEVWKSKPNSVQFFTLFAKLRRETASSPTSQLDSHLAAVFGYRKFEIKPDPSMGDVERHVGKQVSHMLRVLQSNSISPDEVHKMITRYEIANDDKNMILPYALLKSAVLFSQGQIESGFETIDYGWRQASEASVITGSHLLDLQAFKAGQSLKYMESTKALEYLTRQLNTNKDTLSQVIFATYRCVALLRVGETALARQALLNSLIILLGDDDLQQEQEVMVHLLRNISLIQLYCCWMEDFRETTRYFESIGGDERYDFSHTSIVQFLIPDFRSQMNGGISADFDSSKTESMVLYFQDRSPNETADYANALGFLLFKTGLRNLKKISSYFISAPDEVMRHDMIINVLRTSISIYCRLIPDIPYQLIGEDLRLMLEIFSFYFRYPVSIISFREITNAVVMRKLDLLERMDEFAKKHFCEGIEIMAILCNMSVEFCQKFDIKGSSNMVWKILHSCPFSLQVQKNCVSLLMLLIQIKPFVDIVKKLQLLRQDMSKSFLLVSEEDFNSAVECFISYRFRECSRILWKIINSKNASQSLKTHSIRLLNHAILLHLDCKGYNVIISQNVAINLSSKKAPAEHVRMGDLYFGLSIAEQWPNTKLRMAVEKAKYDFSILPNE